ncbi:MAG: ribosome small subunit-dependent GTPase A [bacterium]|nr:ribosome small subunit-dependent GTPase A [bacterium]
MSSILNDYGWNRFFEESFAPHARDGRQPGRVVFASRGIYRVHTPDGNVEAVPAGHLRHHAEGAEELPAVGDWVAVHRPDPIGAALVEAVLPRRTRLSRKVAGERAVEQLVAANIDVVFLVMGLDGDYNLRRLERLLVMAGDSGARPVVVLNKADLGPPPETRTAEVKAVAPGVPVVVSSALEGRLAGLDPYLKPRETVVLVGSSGVGKSTLINRLSGREVLRTAAVRAGDDRGRHTTTHRQLVALPNGSLLIDNPGIRELQLWSAGDGLDDAFEDIGALAAGCRFRDCTHTREPGCAVRAAVDAGVLDPRRLANLSDLDREVRALEQRRDVRLQRQEGRRVGRLYRSVLKHKIDRQRGFEG